ncbi:MAG TPA: hypothetical protein VJN21_02125 [Candidatus Acidoferrales bacterium]|nr:hypothetical protein [Candidatus Acidoferrales bacterium]
MKFIRRSYVLALAILSSVSVSFAAPQTSAPQNFEHVFDAMHWRLIGPFRGGRALAVTGVPGQPTTFYFGAVGGGVWKTTNTGRTWSPIFDAEPIASIGAIAVAPSDPNVIYAGTGEADMRSDISYGDGMYKSTDAGKTWKHIGLTNSRQIGAILVDPHDANLVYVAALGHAYGPSDERGVFRSTDGGATWKRILFKDENTGAIALAFDPHNSKTIYAALWQTRRPPWNVYPPSNGPGSGLYKTTDGGESWTRLENGLPTEGLGRIGVAVAPTDSNRAYAVVDAKNGGLYRSDDAGATWKLADNEARIWGRGWYFCGVTIDPSNPDILYVMNTSTYRSTDGGKSFTAIKGAPGGDDYHILWIEPHDPARMILGSDQGVVISVDGAKTWSTWYNQPTAQFYHVATDNQFPYWVFGAQQDSGAAATQSRSRHRGIGERDWLPIEAGGENGYIAPDPLHPGIVFGGTVTRYDLYSGVNQDVAPPLAHPGDYRHTWTQPLVFSPADPHALYFGTQVLFRTMDDGQSWEIISPDLTREAPGVPSNLDPTTANDMDGNGAHGLIYTISPSPLNKDLIWTGTDDGYIQVTRDGGKTWTNVTPPAVTAWSKVTFVEASHFDESTAYAAVDRHRLDDIKPYIYSTHDGGKTWSLISGGIPDGSYVNVVREDPVDANLLFAGTEKGVYVSFMGGSAWRPLQLNMPKTPIRDIAIHDADMVVATHGRSFWILDDITPLRQFNAEVGKADAYLFKPETAYRVRPGSDEGTPLPAEEPAGENPQNGAIIDYYLKDAPAGPVTLEIFDSGGKLVRRYSSGEKIPPINEKTLDIPMAWVHPPEPPSAEPGIQRFVWDLHYLGAGGGRRGGMAAMMAMFGFGGGPWAMPGEYTVKLTVNGQSYTQPLEVKMDPRVKTSQEDLRKQFDLAQQVLVLTGETNGASRQASQLLDKLKALAPKVTERKHRKLAEQVDKMEKDTEAVLGAEARGELAAGAPQPTDRTTLRYVSGALGELERAVESADVAPTADAQTAFDQDGQIMHNALPKWDVLLNTDLPALNKELEHEHMNSEVIELNQGRPGGAE